MDVRPRSFVHSVRHDKSAGWRMLPVRWTAPLPVARQMSETIYIQIVVVAHAGRSRPSPGTALDHDEHQLRVFLMLPCAQPRPPLLSTINKDQGAVIPGITGFFPLYSGAQRRFPHSSARTLWRHTTRKGSGRCSGTGLVAQAVRSFRLARDCSVAGPPSAVIALDTTRQSCFLARAGRASTGSDAMANRLAVPGLPLLSRDQ